MPTPRAMNGRPRPTRFRSVREMDIVVRTPHGDADVSVVAKATTTTLGDVISAVTGQAVPRLALIDGRPVDAATLLDDAELIRGAVITTEPARPTTTSHSDIEVAQIAGPGAGRIVRLGPGSYRFGPGRRTNADELDLAPVEHSMFEVIIEPTATMADVKVVSEAADVALDQMPVNSPTAWRDRTLTVGSRAFEVGVPTHPDAGRPRSTPNSDGSIEFSRPPRRRSAPERRPVVDALRDATTSAPTLWERRPEHQDAFVLPFGVADTSSGTAITTVDLGADRALAIAGSEKIRSALARTLVIEAATLHSPVDLDIVVLTSPDRVAAWDWAKWLPHVCLDGTPAIWSTTHDIERWVALAQRAEPNAMPRLGAHLTIAVVDDPDLWNRRDAPLRPILSRPHDALRLIALCDDAARAPSVCTTLIADTGNGRMHLHSFTNTEDVDGIRPALTEVPVAADIARALAPLADVDLPAPAPATPPPTEQLELAELIGLTTPADAATRWDDDAVRSTAPIGRRDGADVDVELGDDVIAVVGSSMSDASDVAATWLLAQCIDRSPSDLWVVPLLLGESERSGLWRRLPHATSPHDARLTIEPPRLLARLRAALADPEGPTRIVLIAEAESITRSIALSEVLATLADAARTTDGLTMLVIGDRPADSIPRADTQIDVGRRDGAGGRAAGRVATVVSPGEDSSRSCTPLQPSVPRAVALELRPAVVGRALTPLERRLEQRRAEVPNPAVTAAVEVLRQAASLDRDGAGSPSQHRVAVPPPMPTHLDLDDLFDTAPGDGVPLGVADDPSTAGVRIHWWEPGSGSLLLFGSRRSGVEQVLTTVILGIADRFSADDVHMTIVEPSATRRRALSDFDRGTRVVAPDQIEEIIDALDDIEAVIDRTQQDGVAEAAGSRLVVLISDLAQLRRQYAEHELTARIDDVLAAAGAANSGVDVLAYTAELDGAGPFAMAAPRRLIGASSSRSELSALDVDDSSDLDAVVGRCRSFPGGDLVQLAMSDSTLETHLEGRGDPE